MTKKVPIKKTNKVLVQLEAADAVRMKRLAEQAVETLGPRSKSKDTPKDEKEALTEHVKSMARIVKAVKDGQRDLANETL